MNNNVPIKFCVRIISDCCDGLFNVIVDKHYNGGAKNIEDAISICKKQNRSMGLYNYKYIVEPL
jgi:hypothetical protein